MCREAGFPVMALAQNGGKHSLSTRQAVEILGKNMGRAI